MTYVDLGGRRGRGRVHRRRPAAPHRRAVAAASQFAGHRRGPGLRRLPAGPQPGVGRGVGRGGLPGVAARCATRTRPRPSGAAALAGQPAVADGPERVPVHLVRLGPLYLIAIPGEVTIVAGLRLRRAVAAIVGADARPRPGGRLQPTPTSTTSRRPRSTTRSATRPAARCSAGGSSARSCRPLPRWPARWSTASPAEPGPRPPDLPAAGALGAARAPGRRRLAGDYGRVSREPRARYRPGDTVRVAFVGAHLANDLRRGGTFLEVQREDGDGWRRWPTTATGPPRALAAGGPRRVAGDGHLGRASRCRARSLSAGLPRRRPRARPVTAAVRGADRAVRGELTR